MKNGRLIIAILTSLLDEALIIFVILWGLPQLGINLPLYIIFIVCAAFMVYAVVFYQAGSRALIIRPVKGFTDQVGLEGKAVNRLSPEGTVKISGELWNARAESGEIEAGTRVIVTNQDGFKLIVRRL
jgi:membrane protein implicated in regulation of membrane protease activity